MGRRAEVKGLTGPPHGPNLADVQYDGDDKIHSVRYDELRPLCIQRSQNVCVNLENDCPAVGSFVVFHEVRGDPDDTGLFQGVIFAVDVGSKICGVQYCAPKSGKKNVTFYPQWIRAGKVHRSAACPDGFNRFEAEVEFDSIVLVSELSQQTHGVLPDSDVYRLKSLGIDFSCEA
jgi:hypothetical protein